jgi:N4-gp56 family major capsid protein
MATSDLGALAALRKKVWSMYTSKQGRDQNFFFSNGFMSKSTEDMTKPIQRVTELTETERGMEAVLPLVADIGGAVVGDNELEGNEQPLITDSQTIRIDQIRNAVKSAGRMSEQATVLRFKVIAKDQLGFWLADLMDELLFLTMAGRAFSLNTDGSSRGTTQLTQLRFASDVAAPTSNRIMYAGSATSEATLTAADTMTWDLVVKAKALAERKRIQPIRQGGKNFYVLVLSTEQSRDLIQTADYKAIQSQAMPRGLENPLFTNAKKIIEDVVIYDHPKVFNTLGMSSGAKWGAGSTVDGAQAFLMGAQALGFAQLGDKDQWSESDKKDYDNKMGFGIRRVMGTLKPVFKSKYDSNAAADFGVIHLKTAAAA